MNRSVILGMKFQPTTYINTKGRTFGHSDAALDAWWRVSTRRTSSSSPKKADVTTAAGFRPVSLQNYAPKLAAKILTHCLQGVVTSLISDLQTSFIKGRSITDNFLFASELL